MLFLSKFYYRLYSYFHSKLALLLRRVDLSRIWVIDSTLFSLTWIFFIFSSYNCYRFTLLRFIIKLAKFFLSYWPPVHGDDILSSWWSLCCFAIISNVFSSFCSTSSFSEMLNFGCDLTFLFDRNLFEV